MNKQFTRLYPLILLLSIFLPTLGSIDNVSVRWIGVSILNIIFLFFSFKKKLIFDRYINLVLIFSIISTISLGFSNYIIESISSLSKLFIIVISILSLKLSFEKNRNYKFDIVVFIVIALSIEVIYSLSNYFYIKEINDFTGISMNRNVSTFSILIKLPFLFYLKSIINTKSVNRLLSFLEIFTILSVILLESRLGILILLFLVIFQYLIAIYNKNYKFRYLIIFIISISFVLFYSSNYSLYLNDKFDKITQISLDQSYIIRIEYYKIGFKLFERSPIIGNGVGTWKIDSLDRSIRDLESNEASYYAHNDFLQILSEIGLIGFLVYFMIFLSTLKTIFTKWKNEPIFVYLLLTFGVILIDSLFNFPFSRPQEVILIFIIFTLINSNNLKTKKINSSLIKLFLIALSFLILNLSIKEYKSLRFQRSLLADYYNNTSNISENEINKIDYTYPSLASNLEPISSLMSAYYIQLNNFEKALELVDYGIGINPHLDYSYKQKVIILLSSNKFLEASNTSKFLLKRNPNNFEYADITFSIFNLLKNETGFIEIYKAIEKSDEAIHELYFKKYLELLDYNQDNFNRILERSLLKFPNNQFLNLIHKDLKNKLQQ
ncbi:MAG: O-antigen ligase family protein [Flammeovirgaceae bacterium]